MAPSQGGSSLMRGWRRMLKGGKAEGSPLSARSSSTAATGTDEAASSSGAYLSASATPPRHRTTDSASTLDSAQRSSHKPPAGPARSAGSTPAKMGAPSQASSPGRLEGSPPPRPPALLNPSAQRAAQRHAAARRERELSPPAAPTPAAREGSRAPAGSAGAGPWGREQPPAETDGSDTSLEFPEQVIEEGPPPLSSRRPQQLSPAASAAKSAAAALGPNPLFGGADGPTVPPLSHELSSPGGSHSVSAASEARRLRQDAGAATRPAPVQPLLLPRDPREGELGLVTPAAVHEPPQAPGGSDSWKSASSYTAVLPPHAAQHPAGSGSSPLFPAGAYPAEASWQPGSPLDEPYTREERELLAFQQARMQRAHWRASAAARGHSQQWASEPPPHRPASAHAGWDRQHAWEPAAQEASYPPAAAAYQPQSIHSQPVPPRQHWQQQEPRQQPQWQPQEQAQCDPRQLQWEQRWEPRQPQAHAPWAEPQNAAAAWQEPSHVRQPWPERQWQPQPGWEPAGPPRSSSAGWQEQARAPPQAVHRRPTGLYRLQASSPRQHPGGEEPAWQQTPPRLPLQHSSPPDTRFHSSVGSNWRGGGQQQLAREAGTEQSRASGGARLAQRFAEDAENRSPSAFHGYQAAGLLQPQPRPRASPLRGPADSEAASALEEAAELRRLLAYQQSKLAGAEAELHEASEQRAAARSERAAAQREAAALRAQLEAAAQDREELASVRKQLADSLQSSADSASSEVAQLRAALAAAAAEAELQEERAETAAGELAEFRRRLAAEVESARREALASAALENRDAALLARQLAAAQADCERSARECDRLASGLAAAEQAQAAAEARAEELQAELEQQRRRGSRLEEQLQAALADAADRAAAQQRVAALEASVAELTEALEAAEGAAEAAAQQPSAAQVLQAAASGKLPNGNGCSGDVRLEGLLDSLELDSPVLRGNGKAAEPDGLHSEMARLQQVEALAVDALRALEAQTREAAQSSARASELQASLAQCEAALQAAASRQAALEAALAGQAAAR